MQPVTASLISPMAWVAFQATAVRKLMPHDGVHLIGPVAVVAVMFVQPQQLDFLIPAMVWLLSGTA
ncbi:hypothetical protein [Sulfitobacter sp.]|uniref:hypothetical protein n=1 Tax=Sulfitobacter sp. TaxID=1903071 RepID=UPI003001D9AD